MADDVVVGFEDPVRQPIVAHELPYVLYGVQFRRPRRKRQESDVARDLELRRHMPAGLVQKEHGMGAGSDMRRDLLQVLGHGAGVAPGHDEPGGLAFLWADRSEDVGPFGALIVRRRRACAAPRPAAGDLVLLADARFVLPPDLYLDTGREA